MNPTPTYYNVHGVIKMIVQAESAQGACALAADGVTAVNGYDAIKVLSADPDDFTAEKIED